MTEKMVLFGLTLCRLVFKVSEYFCQNSSNGRMAVHLGAEAALVSGG